jgi:hypothetical protein
MKKHTTQLVAYSPAVDLNDFRLIAEPTAEAIVNDIRKFYEVASRGVDMTLLGRFLLGVSLIKAKKIVGNAKRGAHGGGDSGWMHWKKTNFPEFSNNVLTDAVNFSNLVFTEWDKSLNLHDAKLRNPEVLDFQVPQNPEELKGLLTAIRDTMNGKEMTAFCRGIGRIRDAVKPGDHSGKAARKLSTAEQAAEIERMAMEDSGLMGKWVEASNRSFKNVSDLEITAQCALLQSALEMRNKYLATPKAKRTAENLSPK